MTDNKIWKPLDLIKVTEDYLAGKGIANARFDAELLLCRCLGIRQRMELYVQFERTVSGTELAAYRAMIKRRAAREPVSRIIGVRGFMGLDFAVTPAVLSPRPETEMLVETVLSIVAPPARKSEPEPMESAEPAPDDMSAELADMLDAYGADADSPDGTDAPARPAPKVRPKAPAKTAPKAQRITPDGRGLRILDLGTGSGCIAVSLAVKLPGATVVAVDASADALDTARANARTHKADSRIDFRTGDWFAACRAPERFDFILSNPPYLIRDDEAVQPEARNYDPPLSLWGGRDGLDCYRRIIPFALDWMAPGGMILFEVGAGQADAVASMLQSGGFEAVRTLDDYNKIARVVTGRAPGAGNNA